MRALVLSGGGANGEYQVGALKHIMGEVGVNYDLIVGTSVGSLNGGFLAQFSDGKEAIKLLTTDIWDNVRKNSDIYRKWYHGVFWHLPVLWKNSLYTTAPLRKKVEAGFDRQRVIDSGKEFRAVAVSWNGDTQTWSQQDQDCAEGIIASSSFPMMFEDAHTRGQWYTDGGIREVTPLGIAIKLGATEADCLVCSAKLELKPMKKPPRKVEKFKRILGILMDEVTNNDLHKAHLYNDLCDRGVAPKGKRKVKLRVLRPVHEPGDALDFSREKNLRVRELGYTNAFTMTWDD